MQQIARRRDRELAAQVLRYGLTGLVLAALYAGVYWAGAKALHTAAQFANAAGFIAAVVVGYVLHSRWSFRGHGERDSWSAGRFLVVNLAGYGLNCAWVWAVVSRLGYPPEFAILPIVGLTPAFTFLLNRHWAFA